MLKRPEVMTVVTRTLKPFPTQYGNYKVPCLCWDLDILSLKIIIRHFHEYCSVPTTNFSKIIKFFFLLLNYCGIEKKPQESPLKEKLLPLKAAENSFTDVNAVSSN